MLRTLILAAIIALMSPAVGEVAAQEVPRAFRGLFKPSTMPNNSRHRVDLSNAVGAVHATADLDLQPITSAFDLRLYEASAFSTQPLLQYSFIGTRRTFGVVAGGSFVRYGHTNWNATRYYNHARFSTPLGPRTNVSLRGLASYTPFYSFDLSIDPEHDETELLPPDEAQPQARRSTMFYDVSAQWRRRLSIRSEISAGVGAAYTNYSGDGIDSLTPSGSVRYSRQMTEHFRMGLGYGIRQWNYPDPAVVIPAVRSHDILSGLSYSRPLPFSRRTQVGFDFGSSVAQTPDAWRFHINGSAFVLHPISRSWVAVGSYRRGLDSRAGLSAPIYLFGDWLAATLSGVVARRVAVRTTATYVTGDSLFYDLHERTRWWSASTSVSTLVFGLAAAYVQAGWTGQRFATQVAMVSGLPTNIDRFSISAGISVGLPLVR